MKQIKVQYPKPKKRLSGGSEWIFIIGGVFLLLGILALIFLK